MTIGPDDQNHIYSWGETLPLRSEHVDMGWMSSLDDLERADGYSEEMALLHCKCCISDGYPHEECILHGRYPWRGEWLGAKVVVFNDYLPAGVVYTTEREVFVSRKDWELIYRSLKIKTEATRAVRSIVEREMADTLRWLRGAGHDV